MLAKFAQGPQVHQMYIPTHGNAASTGTRPAFRAKHKGKVTGVSFTPSASVTADGTNYATYTLTRYTAGASATTVATRAWSATNSVISTPESLTLSGTAANLLLAVNDTLEVVKSVAGTGLVIPDGLLVIEYELTGV